MSVEKKRQKMEKDVIVIFVIFIILPKLFKKNHYINNALKENLQTSKSKPIYIRKYDKYTVY